MKYSVATFDFHFDEDWQKDLFCQALFDLGFDTIEGNQAYIQTDTLNRLCPSGDYSQLMALIRNAILLAFPNSQFSIPNSQFSILPSQLLSVSPCEDANWNAVWEAEHPVQELPLGIRIVPHCAFGAGHHETTSMIIDALMNAHIFNKQSGNEQIAKGKTVKVIDHGTGTGVLAIFAKKLGAAYVLALDIDDKSVENAKENATLNNVDIDVRLGDFEIAVPLTGKEKVSLILANIHRNVLLENMHNYALSLAPEGELWLSGFYETDCSAIISAAKEQGLSLLDKQANGDWRMLRFTKLSTR